MIEHVKVKAEDEVRVAVPDLARTVTAIFEAMGVPTDDAALAADVLVTSDVRGVESHGVSNMLRVYVQRFRDGSLNPRPAWRVVRETPAAATIDSDRGLGLVVAPHAMRLAIDKARRVGVGAVSIGNGRHLGMAAYHAMLALPHDMIGYCLTGGGIITVPTFGAMPRLGANPHAWAVPADREPPFVLDISASAVAGNKIGLLRRNQRTVLPGWLADDKGVPIMEEGPPPAHTWLLPVGGTREIGSHKGYGLAVVAQILGGVLSAAPVPFGPIQDGELNHFVAAYAIEAFTDVREFKQRMDALLRYLRETPPAPGHDRVYYAGLPEHEEARVRRARGIPLHREVVGWFDTVTAELGLPALARG